MFRERFDFRGLVSRSCYLWSILSLSLPLLALGFMLNQVQADDTIHANFGLHYVSHTDDCGGAAPCYANIQAAVDAANNGDEIRVAAGNYTDINNYGGLAQVVYVNKTVTIRGGYTTLDWDTPDPVSNQTTLNAQGLGRVLYITGDISPTIEGLRIIGGDATGLGGWYGTSNNGGGVYIITATVSIRNSWVLSNTVTGTDSYGGGMFFYNISAATLNGNNISGNVVSGTSSKGGGVIISRKWDSNGSIALSGNTITGNVVGGTTAYGGGVMLFDGSASLDSTTLIGNAITDNIVDGESYACGGGVDLGYSGAILSGNSITGNTVMGTYYGGGGVCVGYSSPTLVNNIIADNQVNNDGSGLYIYNSFPDLFHNTIARNSGGNGSGIFCTGNSGWNAVVTLDNSIIVDHTVGIYVDTPCTARFDGTLWGSGAWANDVDWSGTGTINTGSVNVWGDPAFVDPDNGDYHISYGSAAIDLGVDTGIAIDIDGEIRDASPDLGADEWVDASPEVDNVSPADGKIDVALEEAMVITFNEEIEPMSLIFTITPNPGGLIHTWNTAGTVVTITHEAFDYGTTYQASVTADDVAGNSMTEAFTWSFTTKVPVLIINYQSGAPGSYFTLTGVDFPPNDTANISVNGTTLGSVIINLDGSFTFILSTVSADEGSYFVTATANPRAIARFSLDSNVPVRPQEGSGSIFEVPAGIAFTETVFLPIVLRS